MGFELLIGFLVLSVIWFFFVFVVIFVILSIFQWAVSCISARFIPTLLGCHDLRRDAQYDFSGLVQVRCVIYA